MRGSVLPAYPDADGPLLSDPAQWAAALPAGRRDNPHSRRVALLKRVLPATGLGLLLLIAMWPRLAPLWERIRFSLPAIDLRDARELRMVNPRYAGMDRLGRPFVVTAATGRQVPDRQDLLSLEGPRADLKTHSGADVVITGATGMYQQQAQLLDLFGNVTVDQQNGMRFVTDTARIDAAHNSAEGSDPVEGHGPQGNVKGQGFRILDKGDKVLFTGRSDMLLTSARPAVQTAAVPPALPAPVVAAAAQTEAAARPVLAAAAAPRRAPPPAAPRARAPVHAKAPLHKNPAPKNPVQKKS